MLYVYQIAKNFQQSLVKRCINRTRQDIMKFSTDSINLSNGNTTTHNLKKNVDGMPNKDKMSELAEITMNPVDTEDKLQPQWVSLERRMLNRKPNKKLPSGRHNLNKSAWDHEHV